MKNAHFNDCSALRVYQTVFVYCCEVISHCKLYHDGINGVSLVSFLRPRKYKKYNGVAQEGIDFYQLTSSFSQVVPYLRKPRVLIN